MGKHGGMAPIPPYWENARRKSGLLTTRKQYLAYFLIT